MDEQYHMLGNLLQAQGYACIGFDHVGCGMSEGMKGYIER